MNVLSAAASLDSVILAVKSGALRLQDVVKRFNTEFPGNFALLAAGPLVPLGPRPAASDILEAPIALPSPVQIVTQNAAAASVTPVKRGGVLKLPENSTPCPTSIDDPLFVARFRAMDATHSVLVNTAVREADERDPYRTLGAVKALPDTAPARSQMDSIGRFGCKVCGEVHNIAKLHQEDLPCLEHNTRFVKNFLIEHDVAPNQRWRRLFEARENSTQTAFAMWERFLTIVMPSDRREHDDSAWARMLRMRSMATEHSKYSIWAGTCKDLYDRGVHLHYMSPSSHLANVSSRKIAERVAAGGSSTPSGERAQKRARGQTEPAPPMDATGQLTLTVAAFEPGPADLSCGLFM